MNEMKSNDEPDLILQKGYHKGKGRSIPIILFDRSIRGANAVGGVRFKMSQMIDADSMDIDEMNDKIDDSLRNGSNNNSINKDDSGVHLNSHPCKISNEIRNYGECYSVTKCRSSYLGLRAENDKRPVVSTISVAFSQDGRVLASTHGDHTVKITCCHSGRLLRSLEGHQRTPWTVKFHPSNSSIVASGCLGFQVRVWNWNYACNENYQESTDEYYDTSKTIGMCLNMIRLESAIISLAFHPTEQLIAAASGTILVLWDYERNVTPHSVTNNRNNYTKNNSMYSYIEIKNETALRCVHFPPDGTTLIIGGVDSDGGVPATTIFSLRLYDFDIHQAFKTRHVKISEQSVLSNCCLLVHRALLYNDGGFDVSPCGKFLCACAEYWLPTDVDCATDLFPKDDYPPDDNDDNQQENTQSLDVDTSSTTPQRKLSRFTRYPVTPPVSYRQYIPLSPPPPPGRRLSGGLNPLKRHDNHSSALQHRPSAQVPRSYSHVSPATGTISVEGRIVPHVVTVTLQPKQKLGQLLEAAPLDTKKASGVTCVKFSPSAEYCLLGYGVRETADTTNSNFDLPHTVTSIYRIRGGMTHVSTMLSLDDDVNIARFHPHSGHGYIYGTKQGKLRIMSPKPWNYFQHFYSQSST